MPARARRPDAVANRERIVAAARAALIDSNGAFENLKLHLVAKAAEVGQGTIYRHFPAREHLLAEVYRQEMGELVDAVPPLLAEYPPLDALIRWLDRLIEYARVKRGVMAAIEASAWQDLYAGNHGRLDDALTKLLDRGKAAGEVRDEIDSRLDSTRSHPHGDPLHGSSKDHATRSGPCGNPGRAVPNGRPL